MKAELGSLLANINLSDYYNKTEMGLIVQNIDLSNYYTKAEIDDTDNELSTLMFNTYTKTEVDTLLFTSSPQSFSAISLINIELELNYKTATQLAETYYNTAEVDNLITFDPNVVCTKTEINPILNSNYSTTDGRDQLFLAYSSTNQIHEAYYDKAETNNLLSNKISNTGDVSISGNLNVDGRILVDGSHLNVQPKSSTSSETLVFDQSFSTEVGSDSHGINVYGRQGCNSHLQFYNGRSGSVCNVLTDGNLDAGGIVNTTTTNLTNAVLYNFPLVVTNTGTNWFQGEYVATANEVGCLFRYKPSGSSTYWWSGVWGSNTNGFGIWFNYQGLSLKSNGSAVLTGSLTQSSCFFKG